MFHSSLRRARMVTVPILASLMLSGISVVSASSPAQAAPNPGAAPERKTYVEAASSARSGGKPVEWLDRRTETDQQFVNPDGSVTWRQYAVPQRVRRGAGWAKVDTTLRRNRDGSVSPIATVTPLTLSGGGQTAPLLTVADGTAKVSLSWPNKLPKPVLKGDTATYPEVYPGIDLQVRAEIAGYSQVLVVKTPEAAKNPALARVNFKTSVRGLQLRSTQDGLLQAVKPGGEVVFVSDGAAMWDSPAPAALQRARSANVPTDDVAPHATRKIAVHVTNTELSVLPDQAMLRAPDTVFPVFIDPPLSKTNPVFWTHVNKNAPNTSYWTGSSRDVIRVGHEWNSANIWRAHFQFDITQLKGTNIQSASFHITTDHTADCKASPVQLWQTNWIDRNKAYTWHNDSDGDWFTKIQQRNTSANEASCPKDDDPIEFGAAALRTQIQAHATKKYSTMTFGLRVPSESDQYQWKKFKVGSAWLEVSFNRVPGVPTAMGVTDCYTQCASPAVVSVQTPELRVKAADPDGGTLTIKFEVYNTALVWADQVTGYASGSATPAKRRVAAGKLGAGWYKWRAQACDPSKACSGWTPWFQFTTDTTAPSPPVIAPVDPELYFEDDGSGQTSGGIGVPGKLAVSGVADVVHFKWSLDGGAFTQVPATGTGVKTAQITVLPKFEMVRTVTVEAYDAAGRKGVDTYQFNVASPAELAGYWKLDEETGTTANDHLALHPATATGGVTRVAGRTEAAGKAARFAGNGFFATVGPVLATTAKVTDEETVPRSFSVSAWVTLADTATHRAIVSQGGDQKSLFELQMRGNVGYCFTMWHGDSTAAASTTACAPKLPTLNTWTHLAGVYDAVDKHLTVYVNGGITELGGSVTRVAYTGPTPFAATSPLRIGSGFHGGPAAHWLGDIDDVRAYQRAVPQEDFQVETLDG